MFYLYVKINQDFEGVLITFDEILKEMSKDYTIVQKSVNSFQSILMQEYANLDFDSDQLLKYSESILGLLNHENQNIVKAAEQTVLTIIKFNSFQNLFNRLVPSNQTLINQY